MPGCWKFQRGDRSVACRSGTSILSIGTASTPWDVPNVGIPCIPISITTTSPGPAIQRLAGAAAHCHSSSSCSRERSCWRILRSAGRMISGSPTVETTISDRPTSGAWNVKNGSAGRSSRTKLAQRLGRQNHRSGGDRDEDQQPLQAVRHSSAGTPHPASLRAEQVHLRAVGMHQGQEGAGEQRLVAHFFAERGQRRRPAALRPGETDVQTVVHVAHRSDADDSDDLDRHAEHHNPSRSRGRRSYVSLQRQRMPTTDSTASARPGAVEGLRHADVNVVVASVLATSSAPRSGGGGNPQSRDAGRRSRPSARSLRAPFAVQLQHGDHVVAVAVAAQLMDEQQVAVSVDPDHDRIRARRSRSAARPHHDDLGSVPALNATARNWPRLHCAA